MDNSQTRQDTGTIASPVFSDTIKVTNNSFFNTRQTTLYLRSPKVVTTPRVIK